MDFEKLYNAFYMQVYSYLMTLSGNPHTAEEITQEVFFKAMKTKHPYRSSSGELTWLCAIAKNTYIDECRKQARFQNADRELTDDRNMEKLLEDEGATLQIHRILHKLEEPYKEVFQLRVFGELSFRKIGQIFDKTEAWARVTYHRARLKIKERMEEHGTEI
ncbi:MAG: RNA polymerase sigma factor [Lachnospiraceae bacterium]|jgi:RNA polymerase sigma-70 factor (ECF subfamily)|nr:RNA polymerase sigma factor [Lachnospiraceae bacterium]